MASKRKSMNFPAKSKNVDVLGAINSDCFRKIFLLFLSPFNELNAGNLKLYKIFCYKKTGPGKGNSGNLRPKQFRINMKMNPGG